MVNIHFLIVSSARVSAVTLPPAFPTSALIQQVISANSYQVCYRYREFLYQYYACVTSSSRAHSTPWPNKHIPV